MSEDYWESKDGKIKLYCADCMDILPTLNGIDAVIADQPYGTTACKWDSIIPLEPMWEQLKRIIKPNGAIVMTASQPFTTTLIASNMEWFRYEWIWEKTNISNPQLAKKQPLKTHENICVFSRLPHLYFPQDLMPCVKMRKKDKSELGHCARKDYTQTKTNYPKSILKFNSERGLHPTQKPVALMEYLIKTYTNEGETVLDFSMGSGTTGIACIRSGRKFIGIEKDRNYFEIAKDRIQKELRQGRLF